MFAGLKTTKTSIAAPDHILYEIRDCPTPINIKDARSWFGLFNQVHWPYSIRPFIETFCKFSWDNELDQIFIKSKELLISKITDAYIIHTSDIKKKHAFKKIGTEITITIVYYNNTVAAIVAKHQSAVMKAGS